MIEQPEFSDSLFIFNDNEEQFLAYLNDPESSIGCSAGGGNAVIRPYRCQDPPRAAGIPTGSKCRGYTSLSQETKLVIDKAIQVIDLLLSAGQYSQVFYSSTTENGLLGTGIFNVENDVKVYILEQLKALICD